MSFDHVSIPKSRFFISLVNTNKLRNLVLVFLIFPMFLSACGEGEKYSWHQKLTVKVDTPDGLKIGSSVIKVTVYDKAGAVPEQFVTPEARGVANHVKGEAVVVDLGRGKFLFALLGGSEHLARDVFATETGWIDKVPWNEYSSRIEKLRTNKIVPRLTVHPMAKFGNKIGSLYPLMVTFKDINDPKSVERVDPDDLAASFGEGYTLKSLKLEITDDPLTTGTVERVLRWLKAVGIERATLIPNPPAFRDDATDQEIQYLSPGSFSTELYK